MFSKNDLVDTYADREHWSHFVHAVTIGSLTYIPDLFRVPGQFELLVHELGKSFHAVGAAAHTHKLFQREVKQRKERSEFSRLQTHVLVFLKPPFRSP